MDRKETLITEIRLQKEALGRLLDRLERKNSLASFDYEFCELTVEAVGKKLEEVRGMSSNARVCETLWGREA